MTTRKFVTLTLILIIIISGIFFTRIIYPPQQPRDNFVPDTISPEAQKALTDLYQLKFYDIQFPAPADFGAWQKMYQTLENDNAAKNLQAARDYHITVTKTRFGKVPALDLRPENWKDNHRLLVYIHGGAFTLLSPATTLVLSAPVIHATGMRVIAIGYTNAPFADWRQIQDEVISVFKALLAKGYRMQDIAVFGDSAGGGLALNTVMNLRDKGMGLPAALVLVSPWADLTNRGDTAHTLANSDPLLSYDRFLKNSALAYAHGLDLMDPRISPLYADFSKPLPPVLIIEGTKCIFLSTNVRLTQALETAGRPVKLDLYEGMWHDFLDAPGPEAKTAITRMGEFIAKNMRSG